MKQVLHLIIMASLFCGCSLQSQNKAVAMDGITSDNIVQKIADSIKHYPQEPRYYMFAHSSSCYYEILVNDFPVYRYFQEGSLATPIWINAGILKSGEQKLTYRMYPTDDVFENTTDLKIDLRVMNNRIGFKDKKYILEHRSAYNIVMVGSDKA